MTPVTSAASLRAGPRAPAPAPVPAPVPAPQLRRAAGQPPTFAVTLPDGRTIELPLAQAVQTGLVDVAKDGSLVLTLAGKRALGLAPQPPAPAPAAQPAAQPASGPTAAEFLGGVAGNALLARNLLKIATGPGAPKWQTLWLTANGLNRLFGGEVLPEFIRSGPIKDAIGLIIPAQLVAADFTAVPEAWSRFQGYLAAGQAASGAGAASSNQPLGVLGALFRNESDLAPDPAATAAVAGQANDSLVGTLGGLIGPLYTIGLTASSLADILTFVDHVKQPDASVDLAKRGDRTLLSDAVQGVLNIATTFMPASPASVFLGAASNLLWLGTAVNNQGWLDGVLGDRKDPPKPPAAAAVSPT